MTDTGAVSEQRRIRQGILEGDPAADPDVSMPWLDALRSSPAAQILESPRARLLSCLSLLALIGGGVWLFAVYPEYGPEEMCQLQAQLAHDIYTRTAFREEDSSAGVMFADWVGRELSNGQTLRETHRAAFDDVYDNTWSEATHLADKWYMSNMEYIDFANASARMHAVGTLIECMP